MILSLLVSAGSLKPCTFSTELQCFVKSKKWQPLSYGKTNAKRMSYRDQVVVSHSVGNQVSISRVEGQLQKRCMELLIQICAVEEAKILKGVVSQDHVHIHIEYPPLTSISQLVKRMKCLTSRLLQKEFPALKNRYCERHIQSKGYRAWSRENITDEMVQAYLE